GWNTIPHPLKGRGARPDWRSRLRERVLGPGAALGWGQASALGRDRAALDAVRRRHLHPALDGLVDLRRAHALPEPRQLWRHVRPHADVVGRVVTRLVAAQEDRRELVERELAVRRGV